MPPSNAFTLKMMEAFASKDFQREDCRTALDPLIQILKQYDDLRLKLETHGGTVADLKEITFLLTRTVSVPLFSPQEICIANAETRNGSLFLGGPFDVVFDVRQLQSGMPVFYLCRIHTDFWAEHSLVVEDLYRSPGFPVLDDRFVKFMVGSREKYHLRLSPFRSGVLNMLSRKRRPASDQNADELLCTIGRHIYQAAWHEDQLPAVLCATHFALAEFKQAIELLYVCLSGELCDLRNAIDEDFLYFFHHLDRHHAIERLLHLLPDLEGAKISQIPDKALRLYCRLNQAFSRFLKVQVSWGQQRQLLPLFKLVFANFSRLEMISVPLRKNEGMVRASQQLEKEAGRVIEELLR